MQTTKDYLMKALNLSNETVEKLIETVPSVLEIDLANLDKNIKAFKRLNLTNFEILKLIYNESSLIFNEYNQNSQKFIELAKISKAFKLNSAEIRRFVKYNDKFIEPNLLPALIERYNVAIQKLHLTPETAIKTMVNTNTFACDLHFKSLDKKLEVLKSFNININKLKGHTQILNNSAKTISNKLKICHIIGANEHRFFSDYFELQHELMYARLKAAWTGKTGHISDIYARESIYYTETGLSSGTVTDLFPFKEEAQLEVDMEFARVKPNLAVKVFDEERLNFIKEKLEYEKQLENELITKGLISASNINFLKNSALLKIKDIYCFFNTFNISETMLVNRLNYLIKTYGFYPQDLKQLFLKNPEILLLPSEEINAMQKNYLKKGHTFKEFKTFLQMHKIKNDQIEELE